MNAIKILDDVRWVGAIDWSIRDFHGYSTDMGTTYNAYLVIDDKITLVDTVKKPFMGQLLDRISSVIDPKDIDYIISNHSEMDHSGCLPEIVELIRPEKIFASAAGARALEAHFHKGLDIVPVKSGDRVCTGKLNFSFLETKMLHWPDSMFSYVEELKLLFSQDAFGMHLATRDIFDTDIPDQILEREAGKYFANILLPYSERIIQLPDQVSEMKIQLDIVATDHGPVWKGKIPMILELYRKWAEQKPHNRAIVVFDTMWGATAKMAEAVSEGIADAGSKVKLINVRAGHRSDIATEMLDASAIIVGSPTLNNNFFPPLADALLYIKGLKPKGVVGAAFGSYGWSGEAVPQLNDILKDMGIELLGDGIKAKYSPTAEDLEKCRHLGSAIAKKLQSRLGSTEKMRPAINADRIVIK